jgi:hypothetical protein
LTKFLGRLYGGGNFEKSHAQAGEEIKTRRDEGF